MTDIFISARRGAGAPAEILYGTVTFKPTLAHSRSTSIVLPAPTTFDLVNGEVVATNVQPTPEPVEGKIEWAYEVTFKDRHSKTYSFLVGVPDSTAQVNFTSLPRYYETQPPLFGAGPKGDTGEAATVAVGTVTGGTTAQVTNTGTNTDAVLNFVLPQGPQGPKGDGVNIISPKPSTDIPDTYPLGTNLFQTSTDALGYPIPWALVVTDRATAGRATQWVYSVSTTSSGRIFVRVTGAGNVWGAFKEFAWNDLATTTANGLMSSVDKTKLDNSSVQPQAGTLVQRDSNGNTSVGTASAPEHAVRLELLDSTLDDALSDVVQEVSSDQTYYVSPTGSDTNDGLGAATAFKTINKAVEQTQNKTYATDVKTYIMLAAGTYAESVRLDSLNATRRIIHIKGPAVGHPNVPTALIQMSAGNTSSGLVMRDPNLELIIEDVKFKGFNGNSSAAGIAATGGGVLRTINVHAELCFWGITCSRSVLDVTGGIFTNNGRTDGSSSAGAAIRSLMLNNHSIGTQYGSLAVGPIFRNNYYGVLAQESSVGHVDYCTFEDNDYALLARVNSRANAGGSVFKRNTIAIQCTGNSYVLFSETAFGSGVDANSTNTEARSGGVLALSTYAAYIQGIDNSLSAAVRKVTSNYTSLTHTGGSTYLYEWLLTSGWWNDTPKSIRPPKKLTLKISGIISGTAGSKSVTVRLGTTSDGAVFTGDASAGQNGSFTMTVDISMIGKTSQHIVGDFSVSGNSPFITSQYTNADMNSEKQLRIAASAPGTGDSVTFHSVELYIEG